MNFLTLAISLFDKVIKHILHLFNGRRHAELANDSLIGLVGGCDVKIDLERVFVTGRVKKWYKHLQS